MEKRKLNNEGFSLVELIVVIAIMAVLVGALAPQFMKYIESSRQSTDIQTASAVRSAIEAYVAENSPSDDLVVYVTVASGACTINVKSTSTVTTEQTKFSDALADIGLASTITCKSTGWSATAEATPTAKYDVDAYVWTTTATANTKKPLKDLADAFK